MLRASVPRFVALGRTWAVGIAFTALLGCASTVNRGADFYTQGRYIDADQLFEQAEPELSQLELGERARYALYRAATYLALGDSAGAQRWLGYGARLGAPALSSLSLQEQLLLHESLRAVGSLAVWSTASSAAAAATGLAARAVRFSP